MLGLAPGNDADLGQSVEGLEGAGGLQFGVLVSEPKLPELCQKFDVAQTARAQLEMEVGVLSPRQAAPAPPGP